MRIAQVIGKVTLSRCHDSFRGATLKLAVPLSLANLREEEPPEAEPLVVWDEFGAGIGSWIAISEGGEAAQPFRPDFKPVDCYNAAILDEVNVDCLPANVRVRSGE
jgi:microcompartment protein CcmK/EutM